MSILARYLADDDTSWRRRAACRGTDPRVFFEHDLHRTALQLCNACPVRVACLDEAIADEREGLWGGTTDRERANIIDQRRWAPTPLRRERKTPLEPGAMYRLLEQLAEHPRRWARIASYPSPNSGSALASLLRNGQKPSPPGRWTFEGRVNDDGGSDLYARYDGTNDHDAGER